MNYFYFSSFVFFFFYILPEICNDEMVIASIFMFNNVFLKNIAKNVSEICFISGTKDPKDSFGCLNYLTS